MPAFLHSGAFALALSGAVLALPAPTLAQSIGIDFGASAGEDFLDGGGFEPRPHERAVRSRDGAGSHDERSRGYETRRSVSYAHSRPRSTYFRGTGVFANANPVGGSVIYVSAPQPAPAFGSPGPRSIDVEAERLDRTSHGPSGISITQTGSMKIIRLSPGYGDNADKDMAAVPAPAALPTPRRAAHAAPALPYEVEAVEARPSPPGSEAGASEHGFLEPWSDEWRQDCEARHRSFDAALGTYLGADGLRRFCTGELG